MKQYMYLFFLTALLSSCDSDDNVHLEVPSVVLNTFHRGFPEAVEVDWQQRDSLYEVDFEIGDRDRSALINAAGRIIGEKQEIRLEEIPSKVMSGLNRNFERSDLSDPERVELQGRTLYQLELDKFLFDEAIVLDDEGKIITNIPYWD